MKKLSTILLMISLCAGLLGQAAVNRVWLKAGGSITFEGATEDAFQTILDVVDPTGNNVITFQNGSGTVAFTSDIPCVIGDISGCLTSGTMPIATGCKTVGDSAIADTGTIYKLTGHDFELCTGNEFIGCRWGSANPCSATLIQMIDAGCNDRVNFNPGGVTAMRIRQSKTVEVIRLLNICGDGVCDGTLVIKDACNSANQAQFSGADCLTGTRMYSFSDASGHLMIDTGIAACTIMMTSGSSGIPVASPITVCGSDIFTTGDITLSASGNWIGGSVNNRLTFKDATNRIEVTNNGVNVLNIIAGTTISFKVNTIFEDILNLSGTDAFYRWSEDGGGQVNWNQDLNRNTTDKEVQIQDVDGTLGMLGGTADESLTVDNTGVTTVYTVGTTYEFTTGTTGADWNPGTVVFDPPLVAAATITAGENYICTTGGTVVDNDDAAATPTLPVLGNYLKVTSDNATAANRTRAMATKYGTGAAIPQGHEMTIEFNATANSQWELTGILSAAGGTQTWNAGAAATIQQILHIQFTGTSWFTRDGIITIIP